jgi:hypothetical protein
MRALIVSTISQGPRRGSREIGSATD